MGSNRTDIPVVMTSVFTPEGYRTRRRRTLSHAVLPRPRRPRRTAFRTHPPANCMRCRHRRSSPTTAATCLRRIARQVSLCNNYTHFVISTRMTSTEKAIITGPTISLIL
jgi:hypothetical protein